jgi:hypothetical protein
MNEAAYMYAYLFIDLSIYIHIIFHQMHEGTRVSKREWNVVSHNFLAFPYYIYLFR